MQGQTGVEETMCFVLYAGTSKPMPRKEWRNDAPDLSVQALTERESPIAAHFSKPTVQHIGSTSGCGCDFPFVMFQNGDWPWFDDGEHDAEQEHVTITTGRGLLTATGNWRANARTLRSRDGDFTTPPAVREEIVSTAILNPSFRFKEQGFYVVRLT
jgi:hypothetical protein